MVGTNERKAFRCSIAPEFSTARLRIRNRYYDVKVLDTSRDGFTIRLPCKAAGRLRSNSLVELWFRKEHWQLRVRSQYRSNDDFTNIGFERVRELTKVKIPSSWGYSLIPRFSTNTDPALVMYFMLAIIFVSLALPGVGENLGTAKYIRSGVHSLVQTIKSTIY
ncbi:MAG: hypothetical protein KDB22_23770 [Planctomycetales bacterium]|nr:hypothetical protein [Planctomycetales bacterium]